METEPSWISPDLNNTFRVTLADVDLDGDFDLACANGESYSDRPQANEIYFNIDGVIESAPGWLSGDIDCSYDVQFEDVDLDGDLDMAVANSKSPTRLYYNEESVLEVFASWSADVADNDNSLAWSDINGDDWPDLSVITNEQLNGSGLIKIYINHEGTLDITPSYTIEIPQSGYGSALCWADFDRDMDEDLAVGSWWGPLAIFENDDGQLQQEPSWQSDNTFVAEALSTIPISSPVISCDEFLLANHPGVYRLSSHPVFGVVNITIGGKPLNPNSYALDNRKGILTMDTDAIPGMVMTVCYRTAWTEYLVATSWGNHNAHGPNFGYLNTSNLPTPTPTVTPTAPPPFRKLSIIMNATDFFRGDLFDCQISIVNQNESFTGDLFFLIEIEGSYYFYPQFDTDLHFERISVDKSSVKTIQILKFNFPDPIGYDGTISLYSALFFPDTYDLICSYAWVRVYLHE